MTQPESHVPAEAGELDLDAPTNAERLLKAKARLAAMTPEHRHEAMLNLLRFMCSDDDGIWDESAAEELRLACAKATEDPK